MELIQEQTIACPYCGEDIQILLDCSVPEQEYIEDCQVCCRPIIITLSLSDEQITALNVRCEDD
ncbi:MAG: CPXCG motif-containing cysteine-rich protein [Sedimenticola selenatireducens]|uniref:CPXCG motif-containing cysteine-rich protein n=2 Tax=Sedimenticola selenatireducens TaxID=191960 RepID=A0A557RV55_9GAMM|nr:CPXCG motif-containing cysteine-rich protein [Sedimenticola selenatireducens]TVO69021.1 CPXCG motif-containing cysteine-rich protein [Sedimenticola selenatireducens]TVT60905.1 MAG: CPXCG motif-containing cysteine-rich protein [Sedimenticola selenatireducens]